MKRERQHVRLGCYKVQSIFISRVRCLNFFFSYYICIQVGSKQSLHKTRARPEPISSFFIKTQTHPICFTNWVRPAPLGSSQTGYPRVRPILPSLSVDLKFDKLSSVTKTTKKKKEKKKKEGKMRHTCIEEDESRWCHLQINF